MFVLRIKDKLPDRRSCLNLYRYAVKFSHFLHVGLPLRGGDVTVYVCDINQPSFPTAIYSDLVSISALMTLSTVFHTIKSPDNSPFSHPVLVVLALPYWSFNYISLYESLLQP